MKYFFCLLFAFGWVGVESSMVSWRIESEFKTDQNRMKVQLLTEGAKVKNLIKTRTDSYINEYAGLVALVGQRLNQRGSDGQIIAEKLQKSFTSKMEELKATFVDQMRKPEMREGVESLKKDCLGKFKDDVNSIKTAVEANRNAMKCWESYREDSRALFDSTIAMILQNVDQESKAIDVTSKNLQADFKAILDKIDEDNTCGSDAACSEKYFSDNSERIFNELNAFSDVAEKNAKESVDQLVGKAKRFTEDFQKNYTELREKIQPCVESA